MTNELETPSHNVNNNDGIFYLMGCEFANSQFQARVPNANAVAIIT